MNILGILLALGAALCVTTHNRQIQKLKTVDESLINLLKFLAASIIAVLLIEIFEIGSWHITSNLFFVALAAGIVTQNLIAFCATRAQQKSEQSLVAPIKGITPLFLLPLGWIFLGETPSWTGVVAVCIIFIGVLIVSWEKDVPPLRGVLRSLRTESGVRFALGFAFFGALGFIVAKSAFQYGSPTLYVLGFALPNVFINGIKAYRKHRQGLIRIKKNNYPSLCYAAIAYGTNEMFTFVGMSLIPVAYFAALKRTSIIFDIVVGAVLGKERDIKKRLLAGSVVLSGVILFLLL